MLLKIKGPRRGPNFSKLPNEILVMICEYADINDHEDPLPWTDICTLREVCKSIEHVASEYAFKDLVIPMLTSKMITRLEKIAKGRLGKHVKTLHFDLKHWGLAETMGYNDSLIPVVDIYAATVEDALSRLTNLTDLTITNGPMGMGLEPNLWEMGLLNEAVRSIRLPGVAKLKWTMSTYCGMLQLLQGPMGIIDKDMRWISRTFPNLKSLEISLHSWRPLGSDDDGPRLSRALYGLLSHTLRLEHLNMGSWPLAGDMSVKDVPPINNLTSCILVDCSIPAKFLETLIRQNSQSLEEVRFDTVFPEPQIWQDVLVELQSCTNLVKLRLDLRRRGLEPRGTYFSSTLRVLKFQFATQRWGDIHALRDLGVSMLERRREASLPVDDEADAGPDWPALIATVEPLGDYRTLPDLQDERDHDAAVDSGREGFYPPRFELESDTESEAESDESGQREGEDQSPEDDSHVLDDEDGRFVEYRQV